MECVSLWEKLRPHDCKPEQREALVSRVLDTMKGQVVALSQNHSTSRVVQAVIKYGSAAHRKVLLDEMKPHLLELSKSPYGHFCVRKLVTSKGQDPTGEEPCSPPPHPPRPSLPPARPTQQGEVSGQLLPCWSESYLCDIRLRRGFPCPTPVPLYRTSGPITTSDRGTFPT